MNIHSTLEQCYVHEFLSKLARPNAGIINNIIMEKALYALKFSHECNSAHILELITVTFVVYIKCCVLLAEHNLSVHGHSSKISDPDIRLFLCALGLHNVQRLFIYKKALALHSFSLQFPLKSQSQSTYLTNFSVSMLPDTPSISMFYAC